MLYNSDGASEWLTVARARSGKPAASKDRIKPRVRLCEGNNILDESPFSVREADVSVKPGA